MDSNYITRSNWPGFINSFTSQIIPHYQSSLLNTSQKVIHGFFGRRGGTSTGIFSTLNMALNKGDPEINVTANKQLICDHLGIECEKLILLNQVHGSTVIEVNDLSIKNVDGDALITSRHDITIGVLTADCLPILIHAKDIGYIAAIHAGRLGLQKGIIEETLQLLFSKGACPHNISGAIGPAIHQDSYQVGPEIFNYFQSNLPQYLKFFAADLLNYKYYLNLIGIAQHKLTDLNITQIDLIPYDTYKNPELFFSCRDANHKNQSQFGNQISVIRLA